MSAEENKAVARRWAEDLWNHGDLATADEIFAPTAICYSPVRSKPDNGPTAYKERVVGFRQAFPDIRFTMDDTIAEEDRVVTRWTGRGTHREN